MFTMHGTTMVFFMGIPILVCAMPMEVIAIVEQLLNRQQVPVSGRQQGEGSDDRRDEGRGSNRAEES